MNIVQAIILSIVEGITEFLPISSTGHLILASKVLQVAQSEFVKSFEIAIQGGAILSVIFLYVNKIKDKEVLKRVIWTFIPTAALGFILYKIIKKVLLGNTLVVILSLLIGGIVMIILEKYFQKRSLDKKINQLTFKESLSLGVIQTISVIPGVSRSATTILGAMWFGLSREAATEFSFMLAVPVLLAATGLDLVKSLNTFNSQNIPVLGLGMIVSFITCLIAIKWLLNYVKNHNFIFFGIYRITIALLFLLLVH